MLLRALALLALLAITLATTQSGAHLARAGIGPGPEQAAHLGHAGPAVKRADAACAGAQHCPSGDAALCEMACASLAVPLMAPGGTEAAACGPVRKGLPAHDCGSGRPSDLDDRPPRPRLL
ncbi:hypothetical protein [Paracoccus spongiarum]|uniref:CopL family metal-binding regulatory protein n=1 Tax=Paracoccus spongiarum TaxID=3064387 RepID=A0ABT9JEG3_9RHOB|nr:hypothetical protein [Paracoccus sp. 2205BS29-5]MDP5308105.1 hypothetical protein [Paracoccus sp. 2205BS29-5]